ncbi:hypothetical protein DESUT3_35440 [Desulfuromonas versatilis]|uniref:Uncharacterized protein n=1 Tax=Desulfuromonas versatilis TaxID=2802975 RepID=A0ABM8HVW9_9BACT|nr:hypothetical protein [Desulfuromonas versatilis]BCR06475.1 hypothetical protein DESUT3_35440 [Desulfuromonas versatilis]
MPLHSQLPWELLALFLGTALANAPLGYLRQGSARFSFGWFFYAQLSLPVIIYLQARAEPGVAFLPLCLSGAACGQLLGGLLNRRRGAEI